MLANLIGLTSKRFQNLVGQAAGFPAPANCGPKRAASAAQWGLTLLVETRLYPRAKFEVLLMVYELTAMRFESLPSFAQVIEDPQINPPKWLSPIGSRLANGSP